MSEKCYYCGSDEVCYKFITVIEEKKVRVEQPCYCCDECYEIALQQVQDNDKREIKEKYIRRT